MKKVFITRQLQDDSTFKNMLSESRYEVQGHSLLEFTPVPFGQLPNTDWLFFYSQNGVRFFYQQVAQLKNGIFPDGKSWEDEKDRLKLAAIGPATAAVVAEYHRPVNFTGDGTAEHTARALTKMVKGKRVLFPRAKHSRRSIQQLLGSDVQSLDLVVYDNIPTPDPELPDADILVFTSPLNAKTYFSNKKIQPSQKVIAIGHPTYQTLKNLGIVEVRVAAEPTEHSLAAAVISV